MQRRDRNALRNMGFSATLLARLLNVDGNSLSGFFTRPGSAPIAFGPARAPTPVRRTTSTQVVGAMLYRGCRFCGAPKTLRKAWTSAHVYAG